MFKNLKVFQKHCQIMRLFPNICQEPYIIQAYFTLILSSQTRRAGLLSAKQRTASALPIQKKQAKPSRREPF